MRVITAWFVDSLLEDEMEDLTTLYQTGSLKNYCRSFDALLNKVTIWEEYDVSIFLCGLIPTIRCPIKLFTPQTLQDAYSLARAQEITNAAISSAMGSLSPRKTYHASTSSVSLILKVPTPVNAAKLPILPTPSRPSATLSFTASSQAS